MALTKGGQTLIDASRAHAELLVQLEKVSSLEDSNKDDDHYEDNDTNDLDKEDDEETMFTPLQRLSKALRTKQQRMLTKRRHPVVEWKAETQWRTENAARLVNAEKDRKCHEEMAMEMTARREHKAKRRAQRQFTKQKETEFRTLFKQYSAASIKSEKRTTLLTQFSSEARSMERQKLAALKAAKRADRLRETAEKIVLAEKRDEEKKQAARDHLRQCLEASDELRRRCGLLPAINTPKALSSEEQDESSSVLILRLSNASTLNDAKSHLHFTQTVSTPLVTVKRQVFTVNLEQCKHVGKLRSEHIGDRGVKELARSLLAGACPQVQSIHLGWNLVKYSGLAALADAFTRGACLQLQELDMRYNNIDCKAFVTLLTALEMKALPELLNIGLQGNLLGDEGARALAHAFFRGTLRTLRRIDVRQNRIRNDGVLALWNVFRAPNFRQFVPKLDLLDMRRNDVHDTTFIRSLRPCPSHLAL